jgi:DedD protein
LESTETREPSYYEVALTNRQVLVAFVVLLTCLLGAFLSGVWVGRGGVPPPATPTQAARPAGAEPVEQLTFFSGREPGERTTARPARATPPPVEPPAKPAVAAPAEDPATEQMRETLEAEMAANRELPAESPAAGAAPAPTTEAPAAAPAAGTRRTRDAAEPKPAARPERATRAGSLWVQVYSSANGERAREIVAQLERAKFPVVLAELDRAGGTNYRVRVGPFAARPEAETAATRLRREQKLDTWITDSP